MISRLSPQARNAIKIGSLCSVSYLVVYIARNILGAVTPQMVESGNFTNETLGSLSSIYFIAYAVGQLINGKIGDKINGKYMMSFGLVLAGICNFLFPLFSNTILAAFITYGLTGFFLSMIYAPMTKLVAENTEPIHATRCSLGYSFASFLGSPLSGILASLFVWQNVFNISSGFLVIMGIICFGVFSFYERKHIIEYNKYSAPEKSKLNIKLLIEHRIIKFTIVSILTGIVRTTVVFWLPTYISQYLGFAPKDSALIFTISTFVISMSTFIAIFIYERLNRNMDLTILVAFSGSSVCFLLVFVLQQPVLNIIFMVLAIISANCAASMLWSRYCPSLRDTGMVSSATGYLDFISYLSAAISSTLFANAVTNIGWSNLILIWIALMIIGVLISLPYKKLNNIY